MRPFSSFDDLKVPDGLFTELESYFIERIAIDALVRLKFDDLDDLNDGLLPIYELIHEGLETVKTDQINELFQQLKENLHVLRKHSWDDKDFKSEPTEKALITDKLKDMLQQTGSLEFLGPFKELQDIYELIGELLFSMIALALYLEGVNTAREQFSGDTNEDAQYSRLGKATKYFYFAKTMLNLSDNLSYEVNALLTAESKESNLRKERSSKAGSESYKGQKEIQRQCIEKYIASKIKDPKLVKSQFVTRFINSLNEDQRRYFSPSNIQSNLLDKIRKYESGKLPSIIFPGEP